MRLTADRKYRKETYTISNLKVNGVWVCNVLEDKDRGLTNGMTLDAIAKRKVYGKTAIPAGTYEIDLNTVSPKFKDRPWGKRYNGIVPRLVATKGFVGILIHPGTDENSTDGCLIVGLNKVKGKVVNSQDTYYMLMDKYLMPAKARGEKVFITIG